MMYYKIINNRQVFSSCEVIKINGRDVSNPTAEMISQAGWQVFVPPIVPPQPQMEPGFSQVVEAVKKILSSETSQLSDEDALEVAALFSTWASKLPKGDEQTGKEVKTGERLWDDGKLWKVLQTHNVMPNWRPADSPSLYVDVSIEEWPAWRQPLGSADAYNQGDQVSHNDKHWTSDVDGNVWEPGIYGWTEVPQTA